MILATIGDGVCDGPSKMQTTIRSAARKEVEAAQNQRVRQIKEQNSDIKEQAATKERKIIMCVLLNHSRGKIILQQTKQRQTKIKIGLRQL